MRACVWRKAMWGLNVLLAAGAIAAPAPACQGIWTAHPAPVFGTNGKGAPAPDRRAIVAEVPGKDQLRFIDASGRAALLQVYGNEGRELIEPNQGLTEVSWAPNSGYVAVSASDGGSVGNWGITVFAVREGQAHRLPPYRAVHRAANRLLRCDGPESSNLGLARWLKGGAEMLVVAQVPPHSVCRNMGSLHGFRVATASGRILESLPYASMRKRWPDSLGCAAQPMP
jgi:hypothetical protein